MRIFSTLIALCFALPLFAANPAFTGFRGTNGVNVTTNPTTGIVLIGPAQPLITNAAGGGVSPFTNSLGTVSNTPGMVTFNALAEALDGVTGYVFDTKFNHTFGSLAEFRTNGYTKLFINDDGGLVIGQGAQDYWGQNHGGIVSYADTSVGDYQVREWTIGSTDDNAFDNYIDFFASTNLLRFTMETANAVRVRLNPFESASSVPFKFDTEILHTNGSLMDVNNLGINIFRVGVSNITFSSSTNLDDSTWLATFQENGASKFRVNRWGGLFLGTDAGLAAWQDPPMFQFEDLISARGVSGGDDGVIYQAQYSMLSNLFGARGYIERYTDTNEASMGMGAISLNSTNMIETQVVGFGVTNLMRGTFNYQGTNAGWDITLGKTAYDTTGIRFYRGGRDQMRLMPSGNQTDAPYLFDTIITRTGTNLVEFRNFGVLEAAIRQDGRLFLNNIPGSGDWGAWDAANQPFKTNLFSALDGLTNFINAQVPALLTNSFWVDSGAMQPIFGTTSEGGRIPAVYGTWTNQMWVDSDWEMASGTNSAVAFSFTLGPAFAGVISFNINLVATNALNGASNFVWEVAITPILTNGIPNAAPTYVTNATVRFNSSNSLQIATMPVITVTGYNPRTLFNARISRVATNTSDSALGNAKLRGVEISYVYTNKMGGF